MKTNTRLSIIIPIFNEEKNIVSLYRKIEKDLSYYSWEVIYVDVGSTDKSFQELKKIADLNKRVKVIKFENNYGQPLAMRYALEIACSNFVVFMDGDGQFEPKSIAALYDYMT